VVLVADPGRGAFVKAASAHHLLEFVGDGGVDAGKLVGFAAEIGQPVDGVQALQLGDGGRMVVDRDIDVAVVETAVPATGPHHQQRRRLLAAPVAAAGLPGLQRRQQALGQRSHRISSNPRTMPSTTLRPARVLPWAEQHIRHAITRPVEAARAGETGGAALGVDDPHLPVIALFVAADQNFHRLFGVKRRFPATPTRAGR
jgi:hypothetical protein